MKSESPSNRADSPKSISAEESRQWDELADAVEPLVEKKAAQDEAPQGDTSSRKRNDTELKEKARLEKERQESRSHEDLVKSGVARAADDQVDSNAMRDPAS